MKLLAIILGLLTLIGTEVMAAKKLPVSNLQAGELYEALVAARVKPIDGVLNTGAINCVVVRELKQKEQKKEYVTSFVCSINTVSNDSELPVGGKKAADVITALNRAGVHSPKLKISSRAFVKTLFVESLTCEKSEQKNQDKSDLTPDISAVYACSLEI